MRLQLLDMNSIFDIFPVEVLDVCSASSWMELFARDTVPNCSWIYTCEMSYFIVYIDRHHLLRLSGCQFCPEYYSDVAPPHPLDSSFVGSLKNLEASESGYHIIICKDGRKITVGDCALFKPPKDSPPFIGFIRSLSLDKDNNLKLRVNWLYRPTEVVLGKGVALQAAPNEVFYSFHRDETLAASLLHPCKVAFLPKGAELPSGVSSFVCRRVYDITNKCLWWLTDKDFINDRQEEVDQLLQKSRSEMHPTLSTNSPKSANGAVVTSPLKQSPDSTHHNMKRERLMKESETSLKTEISKIADKGGLADYESVEKLVQLMQAEKLQKKVDFSCRSMLAGIIACTDKFDCLTQFVQQRGLTVLDGWLQEVNKGKVGYSGSPKDGDKSVEDFLFVLLRALDKLPINLNALQTCNIGKSVNNLRSHKNLEIQKKARSLVDMWKKRVEFEMNIKDSKSTWSRNPSGSSDTAMKSSVKSGPLKLAHGDTTTRAAASMFQMNSNCKDGQVMKEEKSSSSSQSHTNSQCSSDVAKNIAGCSTAGSKSVKKTHNPQSKTQSGVKKESTIASDSNGAENNSHKIIVKIPNKVANAASTEDSSCRNSRASTPVLSDPGLREKNNNEDNVIPATPVDMKQHVSVPESTENELNDKRLDDSSMSSMNALIDSCAKFSEAHTPVFVSVSAGDDDSGMNLLASVATGEITRSGASSPAPVPSDNEGVNLSNEGELIKVQNGDLPSKCNEKMDESSGGASVFMSSTVQKSDESRVEQICAKVEVIKDENHASVTCPKQIENNCSSAQDEAKIEKISSDQEQHSNAPIDHEPGMEHSAKPITETTHDLESCSSSKRIKLEKSCEEKTECKSDVLPDSRTSPKKKDDCAPSSSAIVSDDRKLEFDLNEGFDMDDGEPTTNVSTVFSTPSALPSFITVASAAKRPFVPPEDLLRNKSELGWKGSAATSAFRPAEPRKIASKPVKTLFDFDLNLTDEMGTEDIGFQNSDRKSGGGLELDLNKIDDSPDSTTPPVQSSISTKRNFDLNDGPAVDESTTTDSSYPYIIPPMIQQQQPVFGMRMNNSAMNTLSSWYSPGTATYSAVTTPVPLPDISILGAPRTSSPYNPADFYRGSVLSSSPAMPFQYPAVFPYGTAFPLATSSFSGAYMGPTSSAVSSQYLRPCVVSLPEGAVESSSGSSQKWGRQGLDLNSGPLGVDAEGRDEGVRQLHAVNSQGVMMDDQTRTYQLPGGGGGGGVLKRKEPEGGWNMYILPPDSIRYPSLLRKKA
ncbi:uncharacterized protein [Phyllobates terribilis]|uniref:uncharacterized protein n=1 Tax=Phyllobates terribilis TaxID=111132 RepID=UPI003CCA8DDB